MSSEARRIFHTWDKWECFPAGFYENNKKGLTKNECELIYRDLLSSEALFSLCLSRVIREWKNSCEHYLTNEKMNRIAWLGQASLCIGFGIPSCYRTGYFLMTKENQRNADAIALKYLNIWLTENGLPETDLIGAGIKSIANIY